MRFCVEMRPGFYAPQQLRPSGHTTVGSPTAGVRRRIDPLVVVGAEDSHGEGRAGKKGHSGTRPTYGIREKHCASVARPATAGNRASENHSVSGNQSFEALALFPSRPPRAAFYIILTFRDRGNSVRCIARPVASAVSFTEP